MKNIIYILGFGLVFLLISLVNIFITKPVFNSGDEASNYIIVQEYGTNGKMYLEGKYLDIDYGNNLHQRGLITFNNKLVPFNFLGLPLFYGTFYIYFQDNIKYINIIFLFIFIIFLYKVAELFGILYKKSFGLIFLGVLGCLPILFYFNFPYYNIVPFITFIIPFVYYLLKFDKTGNIKYLYLSTFFAFISIWMRYEQIIFIFLFFVINIFYNKKAFFERKNVLLHIMGLFLLVFLIFFFPLGVLNNELYGTPFTYGYALFTKTFFLEERTGGGILKSIGNILYQSQRFDLDVLWINLKNILFGIFPLFYFLGFMFFLKTKKYKKLFMYILLGLYIIIYTGMSPTYGSGVDKITLNNAVVRYWILLHISFIVLFLYSFKYIVKSTNIKLLIIFLIFTSNILFYKTIYKDIQVRENYINITKEFKKIGVVDSYVITPLQGKYLYSVNNIISWWGGVVDSNYHFEKVKDKLIKTIKVLLTNNEKVYALETKRFSSKKHFKYFQEEGIEFKLVNKKLKLYKLYLKNNTNELKTN